MYKDHKVKRGMSPLILIGGVCVFFLVVGQMVMIFSMINNNAGTVNPTLDLSLLEKLRQELAESEAKRAAEQAQAATTAQREQESLLLLLKEQTALLAAEKAAAESAIAATANPSASPVAEEPKRSLTDEELHPVRHPTKRVAIIVPYYGDKFPTWFTIWTESVRRSDFLYDWMIFYDGMATPPPQERLPPNVLFFKVPSLAQMFAEGFARELKLPLAKLQADFATSLQKWPRTIAEYKPALGSVFSAYLDGYSHWGYGDVDIIFGDLPGFTEAEDLEDFDIVSFTQGDDPRLYLRGQLTFFKNTKAVTVVWKGCPHLSSELMEELQKKTGDKWSFNSAEGCISFVVGTNPLLRLKYAHKGFSEISDTGAKKEHRIVIQNGRVFRCWADNLRFSPAPAAGPGGCPATATGGQGRHSVLGGTLLAGEGELVPASWEPDFGKENCHVYWVSFKYRLCLAKDSVPNHRYHVKFIDGEVYTQRVPDEQAERRHVCEEGAFFHFQGSKKRLAEYYTSEWHPAYDPCKRYQYYKEGLMEIDENGNELGTWGGGDHTGHDHKGF